MNDVRYTYEGKSPLAQVYFNAFRLGVFGGPNDEIASGSGFLIEFRLPVGGYICMVTARHVINDAETVRTSFCQRDKSGACDTRNTMEISIPANCFRHHSDADLAIAPIGHLINRMQARGFSPYITTFNLEGILDTSHMQGLAAVENVFMVGAPLGEIDHHNNLPIVRKGITATPVHFDYDGRRRFLVDIRCFEGSSGSPVVLIDEEYGRTCLLGILIAGLDDAGRETGLAVCEKASLLRDFIPAIEADLNVRVG